MPVSMTAQETFKTVKGQVVDAATKKPLVGVIVAAYGNDKYSAMTNDEGRYTLNVPQYINSVQMRIEGYNFTQCAIADGVADARLYHEAFTEVYKTRTNALQSSEANRFANTSEVSIDPLIAQQLGNMRPSTLSTQFALLTFMKKHGTIITDLSNQFDQYFQRYAREHAKEVGGLETLDFQIKVLYQGQTLERQKELLMCQVDNAQFMDEMAEDIIKAFYSQDLDAIEQAMDRKLDSSCDSTPEENAQLITDRNADWLTKMPSIMADKPTFFAVGAAHLAGDDGVLSLLRKAGYTVSAVTK